MRIYAGEEVALIEIQAMAAESEVAVAKGEKGALFRHADTRRAGSTHPERLPGCLGQ